jgi:hypothetical protein
MARRYVYEYELHRLDAIVATGRFSSESTLQEGDAVDVDRSTRARVERVLPASGLDGRLVLKAPE